jgi:hypothetical protein
MGGELMARQPRRIAPAQREPWLLFIDTNILLDFYRIGGESADRQLKLLEKHKASLILTDQVWMEFLKNRQKVITATLDKLKKPDRMSFPPIIEGYQPVKAAKRELDKAVRSHGQIRKKIEAILRDPAKNDPVYKALKRLFDGQGNFVIARDNADRFRIRSLARKRAVLGYPPRKDSDVAVGDAVNWEWVIHCANASQDLHNVMIVSRDNDYGVTIDGEGFLNDWLKKEFKERVSRKRKIALTQKLTAGLKKLDEIVRPEDEQEEDRVIRSLPDIRYSEFTELPRWTGSLKELEGALARIREPFAAFEYRRFPERPVKDEPDPKD